MRLLLHICCAPCAVYPVNVLQDENVDFEGFFYNPNIHPLDEFERRMDNVERFTRMKGITTTFIGDFRQDVWEAFDGSDAQRCGMCYGLRLERAASYAAGNGFGAFTTTLLVSPYQKHEMIKELGEKCAKRHGIEFYYRDFRPGFRQGQRQAGEMGLYRQKFCGCIISFDESEHERSKKRK